MVCQPHEHWFSQQRRCLYADRRRDGDCHRNIHTGFNQVRIGDGDGNRAANDHRSFGGLFSNIHPDHADIRLHADCDRHREFQHCCHLVREPYQYRGGQQHRRVYAVGSGNCNHHSDVHSRRHKIRLGDGDGDRAANDHLSFGGLFSHIHPYHADISMHTHGEWNRKLQFFSYIVCQPLGNRSS
jgi:hypothetical protein